VPPPESEIDVCAYVHFLLFFDAANINGKIGFPKKNRKKSLWGENI